MQPLALRMMLLSILCLSSGMAETGGYEVVKLPPAGLIQQDAVDVATDINASGLIVGYTATRSLFNPGYALFYKNGTVTSLGRGVAYAINDSGRIAGCLWDTVNLYRAVSWRDGAATILGPGEATDINNSDQIVGYSGDQACLWQNGTVTPLGFLPGSTTSYAYGINANGLIVGYSGSRAFVWEDGTIAALPHLPGFTTSYAWAVNANGQVVGTSGSRACVWLNGVATALPHLPGATTSYAYDISDTGQIVGYSGNRACMWQNGVPSDIGCLPGCAGGSAQSINSSGKIVGVSFAVPALATMWTPVPEPSAVAVMLGGLSAFGAMLRSRRTYTLGGSVFPSCRVRRSR